jgi:hypothetical protein
MSSRTLLSRWVIRWDARERRSDWIGKKRDGDHVCGLEVLAQETGRAMPVSRVLSCSLPMPAPSAQLRQPSSPQQTIVQDINTTAWKEQLVDLVSIVATNVESTLISWDIQL